MGWKASSRQHSVVSQPPRGACASRKLADVPLFHPAPFLLPLAPVHARVIPVVLAMAGGYAHDIEDGVAIHANTIRTARRIWEG
jgi:hypothetical protein